MPSALLNPRLRAALVRTSRLVGAACAAASALYWVAYGWARLGDFLVGAGLWHTDAVGVPMHPSVAAGTPLWAVAAFWAITVVGTVAWVTIAWALVRRPGRRNR